MMVCRLHDSHHHRGLAAVEVFDARAGHVQDEDDRLVRRDPLPRAGCVEALAEAAERAERIEDAGRPVDAGDEAALVGSPRRRASAKAVSMTKGMPSSSYVGDLR